VSGAELRQRLAAILAADVAGYARLMAADERATVAALDAAREVFRAQVESNRGRIVDMAGDSVLAVFETATGAVSAALAIQRQLASASGDVPDDRRMRFRIGVHLGDVIEKADGTVYGDGVNIAARLEGLALPGGITVSESVRSAVKGRVVAGFTDQGVQRVKHIADPLRTYRVALDGDASSDPTSAARDTSLPLPDRPSIAVVPFTNMSVDPEQEYFVDGIVEDIITELSRFQRLFVIARNTSFTYKGQSIDVKKVARELGVHFVLEGSVRKAGNKVRITAQLIDGETGRHVWAERYEDVLSDVFELQERITRQVVGSMVPEIEAEEMRLLEHGRRRFGEADDTSWRAAKAWTDGVFKGQSELMLEAIRLAEQAIDQDQNCYLAWYILGHSHGSLVFWGWTQDRGASVAAAQRAAEMLMMLAPKDGRSYFQRAWIEILVGDFARGLADYRRALELTPNDAFIMTMASWTEASVGNVARAKELADQAIRTSPKDRWIGTAHLAHATSAFIERDFAGLRHWGELAVQSHSTAPIRRVLMIACAAEVGDAELRRAHLEALQRVAPDFIPSLFRGEYRPFGKPEHMTMLLDSLRKAGLAP
jgi:TolB-like protein/class 3 adenylate cyclase